MYRCCRSIPHSPAGGVKLQPSCEHLALTIARVYFQNHLASTISQFPATSALARRGGGTCGSPIRRGCDLRGGCVQLCSPRPRPPMRLSAASALRSPLCPPRFLASCGGRSRFPAIVRLVALLSFPPEVAYSKRVSNVRLRGNRLS